MPINSLGAFLRARYPYRVKKLPIHIFAGCPHKDSSGGCVFCNNAAFSGGAYFQRSSVKEQVVAFLRQNARFNGRYILYLQSETALYAGHKRLKGILDDISEYKGRFVGVSIATRPDCIDMDKIGLFRDAFEKGLFFVELGLQSANDNTLLRINRGHTFKAFETAVERLSALDCHIVAHLILGLPGEGKDDVISTFKQMNRLKVNGVKLHHLQVFKGTALEEWHQKGECPVMSEDEYARFLVEALPYLSYNIVLHRLCSQAHSEWLVAPKWQVSGAAFSSKVVSLMRERGVSQGQYA